MWSQAQLLDQKASDERRTCDLQAHIGQIIKSFRVINSKKIFPESECFALASHLAPFQKEGGGLTNDNPAVSGL